MPKAFTHLCKNVNLSLYNDTLTVYPKSSFTPPPVSIDPSNLNKLNDHDVMNFLMTVLFSEMDCMSAKVGRALTMEQNELGIYRFVHRDDPDHNLYHQDTFDLDNSHYHAQFRATIDELKLEAILAILQKHSLITLAEHNSFLNAYHTVNPLPHDALVPVQKQSKSSQSVTPPAEEAKNESPKFAGLKRGFFQNPKANQKNSEPHEPKNSAINLV